MNDSDNREEVLKAVRERHKAYLQLFGPLNDPTPLGEIVLDDLRRFAAYDREAFSVDKEGRSDDSITLYRLGKQTVFKRIVAMLEWNEHGSRDPTERSDANPDTNDNA